MNQPASNDKSQAQNSVESSAGLGVDCSLAKSLSAIADHFEGIEHLMAEMRAYDGAQQAREAAEAFRRTKTLMEAEEVAESYFSNDPVRKATPVRDVRKDNR